jgi:hypothetical protein
VSLQLHAIEGNVTLDEKFKNIDTLIRFGILELTNEDGQLLTVTPGSLQYHTMYHAGTKGLYGLSSIEILSF